MHEAGYHANNVRNYLLDNVALAPYQPEPNELMIAMQTNGFATPSLIIKRIDKSSPNNQ
jgi:hypothetical protein